MLRQPHLPEIYNNLICRLSEMEALIGNGNYQEAHRKSSLIAMYINDPAIQCFPSYQDFRVRLKLTVYVREMDVCLAAMKRGENIAVNRAIIPSLIKKVATQSHLLSMLDVTYNHPLAQRNGADETSAIMFVYDCKAKRKFMDTSPILHPKAETAFQYMKLVKSLKEFNDNQLALLCEHLFASMESIDKTNPKDPIIISLRSQTENLFILGVILSITQLANCYKRYVMLQEPLENSRLLKTPRTIGR